MLCIVESLILCAYPNTYIGISFHLYGCTIGFISRILPQIIHRILHLPHTFETKVLNHIHILNKIYILHIYIRHGGGFPQSVNIEYTHCAKRNNITFKINLFLTLHRTRVIYIWKKNKQTNIWELTRVCVMIAIPLKFCTYMCLC